MQSANTAIISILFLLLFNACKKKVVVKESKNFEIMTSNSFADKITDNKKEDFVREVTLYSYDKTVNKLKQRIAGPIDFKEDLVFIYSIAMHTDSFFIVSYQPPFYEGDIFDADISTNKWQVVKTEVVELYESIQFEGVNCDMSYLRPSYEISENIPILNFHTSSFKFLKELDKMDKKIRSIDVSADQLLLNAGEWP